MAPAIHIDVRWLLQQHEAALPDQPHISDFSALVAAVARHRVDPPRLGVDPDASWRAAALLHTLLLLKPLPSLNVRFACAVTIAYMHASGEALDAPYGELVELCKDLIAGKDTVFGASDRLRSWRV
ncbi:toxin Doc (plasmid) [Streptomyces sp. NBC_01281]|uniref:toxin Doc n=1 Tax=Streptomyces sp. NBC_01281 TaxID=2903811 RepID=UPI002E0D2ED7|nr:toxin Doc [Streptomyces sp. NBC_01281]WSK66628.1 toxin Doc [Streptomyces sp. NBC_01281]